MLLQSHRPSVKGPAAYNRGMRPPSLRLFSVFGVELRLHLHLIVAFALLLIYSAAAGRTLLRGFALWLLLLAAIAVREISRAIAAAALGIDLRRLVLLPIGAIATYVEEPRSDPQKERLLALVGPIANFVAALTVAMLVFSVTSRFNLFERPIVEPGHLLRATVWLQVLMGGLHLLPAVPLDAGTFLRQQFVRARGTMRGNKAAAGLGQALGWLLVVLGAASKEMIVIIMGGSALLTAQIESNSHQAQDAAKSLTMGDVMLTEWTSIAASDTLQDALQRSTHSLQDVFPVLRGPLVVGSVTRGAMLSTLRTEGNGYVQSVMSRGVRTALPTDPLIETLQGVTANGNGRSAIMPIMEGDRVIGMVTPQNLSQTMVALGQTRRTRDRSRPGKRNDVADD